MTICNQNPYKLSIINEDFRFSEIANLMKQYEQVVSSGYRQIPNDSFTFNVFYIFFNYKVAKQFFRRFL